MSKPRNSFATPGSSVRGTLVHMCAWHPECAASLRHFEIIDTSGFIKLKTSCRNARQDDANESGREAINKKSRSDSCDQYVLTVAINMCWQLRSICVDRNCISRSIRPLALLDATRFLLCAISQLNACHEISSRHPQGALGRLSGFKVSVISSNYAAKSVSSHPQGSLQRKIPVGEMDDNGNNGNDGKVDANKNDKGMFHFPPPCLI